MQDARPVTPSADLAISHIKYTIPLAILLTVVPWPLYNRLHFLQVGVLVSIAVAATLPWDAYLIRHNVWTYPPEAIVGPRLYGIPFEELFFFVIQTYITSLSYILCNKPVLHPVCLDRIDQPPSYIRRAGWAGQAVFIGLAAYGAHLVHAGGEGTYLGLILVWAPPFALLIWTVAGRFIIRLPWSATVIPVLVPTMYLCLVDELALGRGTWSIESGTKLGTCLFGVLEMEEATFFLATNILIVFGMATFDKYLAVIHSFPHLFPTVPRYPTPLMLIQSRIARTSTYDMARVSGIVEAVARLRKKSRSFYLASGAFSGRLRIDLILLYSFCRMADDLVDSAGTADEVTAWIAKLSGFLDLLYKENRPIDDRLVAEYITDNFPPSAQSALSLLPAAILPPEPLYLLLDGFRMDALFDRKHTSFPIIDDEQLCHYGSCVAGTVGELCVALIAYHCDPDMPVERLQTLRRAAAEMGIALQYVNIARDIAVDARIGRVYLPTTWLKEAGLDHTTVIEKPTDARVEDLRHRLLARASDLYEDARPFMGRLPAGAKGPMIAAVECYMEIGRVLRAGARPKTEDGRATVPLVRRLQTAYKALWQT